MYKSNNKYWVNRLLLIYSNLLTPCTCTGAGSALPTAQGGRCRTHLQRKQRSKYNKKKSLPKIIGKILLGILLTSNVLLLDTNPRGRQGQVTRVPCWLPSAANARLTCKESKETNIIKKKFTKNYRQNFILGFLLWLHPCPAGPGPFLAGWGVPRSGKNCQGRGFPKKPPDLERDKINIWR